jgi:hypothetical protein
LIIVIDELDRPPEQTAFGVGLFLPNLHAEQRLLAVGGERTGQRHPEPILIGSPDCAAAPLVIAAAATSASRTAPMRLSM